MNLPDKIYLTRSEIIGSNSGISVDDFKKVIKAKAITHCVFPGCKYGKYRRDEIIEVFRLDGSQVKKARKK